MGQLLITCNECKDGNVVLKLGKTGPANTRI